MLKATEGGTDREEAILAVPEDRKVISKGIVILDLSDHSKEYENHMMPVQQAMDSINWLLGYNAHWEGRESEHPRGSAAQFFDTFKKTVLDNFIDYRIPVIELNENTKREAICVVFKNVNTTAVKLDAFKLATASFASVEEGYSLKDDWEARKHRMWPRYGVLQGVEGSNFLQAIALLKTQNDQREALKGNSHTIPVISCKEPGILALTLDDNLKWAGDVEQGFVAAGKFLRRQFIFSRNDMPYDPLLVPLGALFVELGKQADTSNAQERLARWFWCCVFDEAYNNAVATKSAQDLVEVAEYVRSGAEPTRIIEASFSPDRLVSLRGKGSAAYKGLYALQMKMGAFDWRTAQPLSFDVCQVEKIDIHHIFPKAWCENRNPKIEKRIYDSIINKTPIGSSTNRIIGEKGPAEYILELSKDAISEEKLLEALMSHWLDPEKLEANDFGESFVARGQAMLDLVNDVMGKPRSDGRRIFRMALSASGYASDTDDIDEVDYDPIGEDADDTE